jgi:uncharacterized membrane protein YedE/YeeE
MTSFLQSLLGGALIGLAASSLLLLSGRLAGVSGIVAGLLQPRQGETLWRALFVAGMVAGGVALALLRPAVFQPAAARPPLVLVAAGVLIGFGTRLGSGCTSGHGICGVSRLSRRSIVATATFMLTGAATVFVSRYLLGAA